MLAIPSKYGSNLYKRYKHKGLVSVQVFPKPSIAYEKWEKEARASIYEQKRGLGLPATGPVRVKAVFYFKGPRPDLHGVMQSVADSMEGILWENDRQIERWHGDSRLIHDLKNPRTEIEVEVL